MVNISIDTNIKGNEFIIGISGEIDLNTVDTLDKALQDGINQKKDILIDMNNVRFIDSTGIGLLVQTYKILKQEGKQITILNAKENVKKVFKITCLEETFNMGV